MERGPEEPFHLNKPTTQCGSDLFMFTTKRGRNKKKFSRSGRGDLKDFMEQQQDGFSRGRVVTVIKSLLSALQ